MPRKARAVSGTGVYHVILRGVNKQRIFEWPEDYDKFYEILRKTMYLDNLGNPAPAANYELYAYCLMDNHAHLLLRERTQPLAVIVKRIASSYAQCFNLRYKRVGHLFQDRFRSEPCDRPDYFLTLLDYIHNNPVKAGVSVSPAAYAHCSYSDLLRGSAEGLCTIPADFPGLPAKDIISWLREMPIVDPSSELEDAEITQKGQTPLCNFLDGARSFGEERSGWQLCNVGDNSEDVDRLIVDEILRQTGCESITAFQQLPKKPMREALAAVRDAGVSIRRLSRLTGISEGVIRGCKNPKKLISQPAEED